VNHDDAEHGPKCQCIECISISDLELDWRMEHEKEMTYTNALRGIGDDK